MIDKVKRAGALLASERRRQGKTLEQAATYTGLTTQVISNVENGAILRPRLEIVSYGSYLGFTPNQVAQLFGYWEPTGEIEDVRVGRLKQAMGALGEDEKENLLQTIDALVLDKMRRQGEEQC